MLPARATIPEPTGAPASGLRNGPCARLNAWLAVRITDGVGTMWCAYLFALLACLSLPDALHAGLAATISWIAQTFLQLVLLSIVIVGQKVESAASDERSAKTYADCEEIALEVRQILALLKGATPSGEKP